MQSTQHATQHFGFVTFINFVMKVKGLEDGLAVIKHALFGHYLLFQA